MDEAGKGCNRNLVFFPHIKHKNPGFYDSTYAHLLFGQFLTKEAWWKSYRLIYDLMELNKQDVLLIPGTWFYDPYLPEIDKKFDWEAREIAPIQLDFALSQSERRRQLYKERKYQPKVAATFTSRRFLGNVLKLENEKKDRKKTAKGNR